MIVLSRTATCLLVESRFPGLLTPSRSAILPLASVESQLLTPRFLLLDLPSWVVPIAVELPDAIGSDMTPDFYQNFAAIALLVVFGKVTLACPLSDLPPTAAP